MAGIKSLLLASACLSFAITSFAQSKETAQPSNKLQYNLTFQPLFLLNRAIKLDLELNQSERKIAFIAGAEFYNGDVGMVQSQRNEFDEAIHDKVKGIGINLALKYNLSGSTRKGHFYVSPGFVFRNLELQLKGPGFYSYMEDNVEYFAYGETEKSYKVKPTLFYANFGYQLVAGVVVIELYGGLGYKSSKEVPELERARSYSEYFQGYTHNGNIIQGGIKLGFQLKPH
jgi:hypothetical protein